MAKSPAPSEWPLRTFTISVASTRRSWHRGTSTTFAWPNQPEMGAHHFSRRILDRLQDYAGTQGADADCRSINAQTNDVHDQYILFNPAHSGQGLLMGPLRVVGKRPCRDHSELASTLLSSSLFSPAPQMANRPPFLAALCSRLLFVLFSCCFIQLILCFRMLCI